MNTVYGLDAIEEQIKSKAAGWAVFRPIVCRRSGSVLTITQEPIFDGDGMNYAEVTAGGDVSVHWSFPHGVAIQGIIEDGKVTR